MAVKYLDVRSLVPPDPFLTIVQSLVELEPGQILKVHHRRQPFPLFDRLADMGFEYGCHSDGEDGFYIEIWHSRESYHIADTV